jgi:hypothetical protein
VRVPTFDRPDDPRQSPQPSAEESLDVFAGEGPVPSSGRLHATQSDKLIIVEIEERPGDSSPLDSFATERVERQPSAPPEIRFDSVPLERSERFERFEQPARIERSQRFGRSAGLLGLAAVAIVTVLALNWARDFVASPSEAEPAEARVESPPRTEDRLVALPEPAVIPPTDVVTASSKEPADAPKTTPVVAPKTTPVVAPKTTPVVVPKKAPVDVPTATARTVTEPPLRAPRAEIVSRPVAESAPPPAAQVPTTGVAAVEVRSGPSASLPIVSTIGTTPTTAVAPAAASPAAASTVIAAPPPGPPVPDAAAAARVAVPRAAVESVLGRYARAFSSLDARSAKAVWPNVNQRNLERAFEGLQQQHFDLGACDITVLPPRALALCDGTARYTPKVGDRKERIETRRWTFHLIQDGQDWSIEDIDTR